MTTKAIQQQIDALQARREALHKDLQAARTKRDAARRAFVGKGGDEARQAFVEAQAAASLLVEALSDLDQNLERLRAQREEAEEAEQRAARMEQLVRLSKEAASARGDFEDAYRDAAAQWEAAARRLADASTRWRAAHKAFTRGLGEIAPGITTVATRRADPERLRALEAERDVVLQALEEAGADLASALSERVTSHQYYTKIYPYKLPEAEGFQEVLSLLLRQGYRLNEQADEVKT